MIFDFYHQHMLDALLQFKGAVAAATSQQVGGGEGKEMGV